MYSFDGRIRYSEVDQDCQLTLYKLIDYFQDCCIFHSESVGLGVEALEKEGKCWMLTGWQIVIERMPHLTEKVTTSTWPYAFRSCNGWRNFIMTDEAGNIIAKANSQWVFMDLVKGGPTAVTEDQYAGYQIEDQMEIDCDPKRIRVPKDCEERPSFFVRQDHIDSNHHVNNGQYVKMAVAQLSEEPKVVKMRAEYKRQALLGDEIFPKVKQEDGVVIVSLDNALGKPYAVVEIETGKENEENV